MKLIIDIPEAVRTIIIDRANNGLAMPLGIQAVMVKSIVKGTPLDDIKAEIESEITGLPEDSDKDYWLNSCLDIIDKHTGK